MTDKEIYAKELNQVKEAYGSDYEKHKGYINREGFVLIQLIDHSTNEKHEMNLCEDIKWDVDCINKYNELYSIRPKSLRDFKSEIKRAVIYY